MIPAPIRRGLQHVTRIKPSFIIIGAQRAGTTSLYNYLCEHPAILPARRKEVHFFNRNFAHGTQWYWAQFPAWIEHRDRWGKRTLTGESTPAYVFHPLAAQRVRQTLPDVKLIVLLRNPVDRAFSHYRHGLREGYESLPFGEALALESARTDPIRQRMKADPDYYDADYLFYSYRARGIYADQLARWFDVFPREQFLIDTSEAFYADPAAVMNDTFAFLSVSPWTLPDYPAYNQTERAEMDPAIRAELAAFYAPHNARLYALLGRDLGWN
jgi:hypothetical protein